MTLTIASGYCSMKTVNNRIQLYHFYHLGLTFVNNISRGIILLVHSAMFGTSEKWKVVLFQKWKMSVIVVEGRLTQ